MPASFILPAILRSRYITHGFPNGRKCDTFGCNQHDRQYLRPGQEPEPYVRPRSVTYQFYNPDSAFLDRMSFRTVPIPEALPDPTTQPEPRYVPEREAQYDPVGYWAYKSWERANMHLPRVKARLLDPEPPFCASRDKDIARGSYHAYVEWAGRHPDIAREYVGPHNNRPGDMPNERGAIPFYGARKGPATAAASAAAAAGPDKEPPDPQPNPASGANATPVVNMTE